MPAVVSYGIRLVSRAICISSVLTSSRSVSRSACSAELFVFCSYSEYLAASEKYRRMQSGRLQKARSLRCRPQTPTRRGSRRDRRCSIAYPPEADRRHRPVMNTAHFDLRSHILRSDRRCSAEGMRSGSAHWNPSSPPARGGGEMLSTPCPLHRPFSTKCRKDFFRKELHTLLGLGTGACDVCRAQLFRWIYDALPACQLAAGAKGLFRRTYLPALGCIGGSGVSH